MDQQTHGRLMVPAWATIETMLKLANRGALSRYAAECFVDSFFDRVERERAALYPGTPTTGR
jgi:hypothetical protein